MALHSAGASAEIASKSSTLARKVMGVADPGRSLLGRVGDTAVAVQLATRLLPTGWRLLKRYPVRSSLMILGLALAAYSLRPMNNATRK